MEEDTGTLLREHVETARFKLRLELTNLPEAFTVEGYERWVQICAQLKALGQLEADFLQPVKEPSEWDGVLY